MKHFVVPFTFFALAIGLVACTLHPQKTKDKKKTSAIADTSVVKYQLITDAIKSPVQLVAPPDGTNRLFVCDLSGKVFILKNGHLLPAPFIDVSSKLEQKDTAPDVRAVFSMALHPNFATNKKFYVCYNAPASNQTDVCKLRISEFKARTDNADLADPASERTVLEIAGPEVKGEDCQIAFGPDGFLYISTGAHVTPAEAHYAQDLHSLLGKVLRIDVNRAPYAVPADNPFVGNNQARPEIWAYGFRRLWRFSFDPQTQRLFGADVGDKAREEIDLVQKGGNYGWPIKEGDTLVVKNTEVDTSKFIAPLNIYTHKDGICVIGGSVYHGTDLPFLKDKYVFADYKGSLFSLAKDASEKWVRQPLNLLNAPTDPLLIFSLDKDMQGELYVLGVQNTAAGFRGVVYKLVHS